MVKTLSEVAPPHKLRQVKALPMAGIEPAGIQTSKPRFEWVRPTDLFIEERYQRNIAEKSITLIRRIVQGWDWSRMKPPICARSEDGKLFVVDGQHTAIAAASHPGIEKIPVMIVDGVTVEDRASSFLGHNRDRVAITPMQMHYAALAAGDEIALAMAEACKKAGVVIRKSPPPNGTFKDGETVAVGGIRHIVTKKGAVGGARVLKILNDANRAPISAQEIKAVAALLWDADWKDQIDDFDLATIIRSKQPEAWAGFAESKVRKGMKMPLWRAIAIAWFTAAPKRRKSTT